VKLDKPFELNWTLENGKLQRLCWRKWIGGKVIEPKKIKRSEFETNTETEKAQIKKDLIYESYQKGVQLANAYFFRVKNDWAKIEELKQNKAELLAKNKQK